MNKLRVAVVTLWTDPKVFLLYCLSFLYPISIPTLKTIPSEALLTDLQNGRSLIRVGDGEAMMYMGRSIHYQIYSPVLQKDIQSIISEYSSESPYILSVPFFALQNSVSELIQNKRMRIWRLFRTLFTVRFNHQIPYADAVMFYHQNVFTDTLSNHLQNKKIIVVTKSDNLTSQLKSTLTKLSSTIVYIDVPAVNAFSKISETITAIDKACGDTLAKELVILVAAGPAAKSLVYHYAHKGLQALDIGHGIEIIGQTHDYSDRL